MPSIYYQVLSVTKKAYRPFIGVFEAADIQRFLVDTARGRGRVFQYRRMKLGK